MENTGWKLFLGLHSMGLIIGLSIIISTNPLIPLDLLTIIIIIAGAALILILLKGITSKPSKE